MNGCRISYIVIGHDEAFLETLHIFYQNMVLKIGWAAITEIKASSQILKRKINVWLVGTGWETSPNMFSPSCILSPFGNEFEGNDPINVLFNQQHCQLLQPLILGKNTSIFNMG